MKDEDRSANEATAREFIRWITETAETLPAGLDTPIDLGICDGHGQQVIDHVEVLWQVFVDAETAKAVPGHERVVIKGHWHEGESPGRYLPGVGEDVGEVAQAHR